MPHERRRGFFFSALFHLLLMLLAIFGLPSILNSPPPEPMAISVELLPISELSNVKPSEPEPEKPAETPKEKEQAKPSPPVRTAEAPPPPPPEKPAEVKEEKKKEKPKEPEKKLDDKKDKKKKKEDDLAAVLKAVKETAQKEKAKAAEESGKESKKASSQNYDESMPLSLSEKDAIRSQIARCWSVPAGAKDAHDLVVVLKLQYEQDGSLIKVALANESKARYSRDSFFRAAADSAMRAVRQCSPLQNLPPDKFNTWRDMELTFDPREMLF